MKVFNWFTKRIPAATLVGCVYAAAYWYHEYIAYPHALWKLMVSVTCAFLAAGLFEQASADRLARLRDTMYKYHDKTRDVTYRAYESQIKYLSKKFTQVEKAIEGIKWN